VKRLTTEIIALHRLVRGKGPEWLMKPLEKLEREVRDTRRYAWEADDADWWDCMCRTARALAQIREDIEKTALSPNG
jgi:hypothetical protein